MNENPALPGNTGYAVKLDFFSGPMDLLLHLVHQQEVPIEKVQMSLVCEQYLAIVTGNQRLLDLEKASEYLVIAATLLAIKSRSLLPAMSSEVEEEQLDQEWFDQRFFEDLRTRIQAYETTKLRAQALMKMPQLGVDTFTRVDRQALKPTPEMLAEPEDAQTLGSLFRKLLKRIGAGPMLRIAAEPVSIVSMMMKIVDAFGTRREAAESPQPRTLGQLLRSFVPENVLRAAKKGTGGAPGLGPVRAAIIGSFIGVLELVKRGVVAVESESDGLAIGVQLRMSAGEELKDGDFDSEFDRLEQTAEAPEPGPGKVIELARYRREEPRPETKAELEEEQKEGRQAVREAGNV